jgi:gliding motility-associated-like protein
MGCSDTVVYPIEIQEEFTFYVPTAFSPDHDQHNDFFYAIAHGIKESDFYLAIYDRWGEIIWETDKYNKETERSDSWDGRAKNHAIVNIGTYTWYAKFKDFKGNEHIKAGAVTVIR